MAPRKPKVKEEESHEEATAVAEAPEVSEEAAPEVHEEEEHAEEAPKSKGKWPEVTGNGRFQAVSHKDGFVAYNPDGSRISDVLSDSKAKDLVNKMNAEAHIKG